MICSRGPKLDENKSKVDHIFSNLILHGEDEDNVVFQNERNFSKHELSFSTHNNNISNYFISTKRGSKSYNQSSVKGPLYDFLLNVKKIKIVKRAAEKLKEMSCLRKPEYLKRYHYGLFNDETINPYAGNQENVKFFEIYLIGIILDIQEKEHHDRKN